VILPAPLRVRAFEGEITVAVRRWKRPTVRAGGTLRTPSGVLAIDSVERVRLSDLTPAIATAAGYGSLKALVASLAPTRNPLYVVRFHPGGPDPRVALRERADLTAADRAALDRRLDGFDERSPRGPWTRATLRMIADRPAVRAPDLAADAGVETKRYKTDVRKLKELGLTESLEVGYRLSPRGRAYLGRA
jgi:hypothetical protein